MPQLWSSTSSSECFLNMQIRLMKSQSSESTSWLCYSEKIGYRFTLGSHLNTRPEIKCGIFYAEIYRLFLPVSLRHEVVSVVVSPVTWGSNHSSPSTEWAGSNTLGRVHVVMGYTHFANDWSGLPSREGWQSGGIKGQCSLRGKTIKPSFVLSSLLFFFSNTHLTCSSSASPPSLQQCSSSVRLRQPLWLLQTLVRCFLKMATWDEYQYL